MRTLTIAILFAAISLSFAALAAYAGYCQTDCYPRNDGSGGYRCVQQCYR